MTDPIDSGQVQPTDLLRYEQQTQALYKALVEYQTEGGPHPADHDLAIFHQVQHIEGVPHVEGVLVHVGGGSIVSGPLPLGDDLQKVLQQIRCLLLGVSHDQQTDAAPAPAAEPACELNAPEAAEPAPTPAAATPSPDDEPSPELHDRVLDLLDQLHGHNKEAMKVVATAFRERFEIGRNPLIKSITTVARANWLIGAISEHLPGGDEPLG
jgi:hypothetical protein